MKIALTDKQRVLNAARHRGDWRAVAEALRINYKTACQWISLAERDDSWIASPSKRGGARCSKTNQEMKTYISARMDENCHTTLGGMASALLEEYSSDRMNSAANKAKRLDYLIKLSGKKLFYFDETNYNVWCARNVDQAPKGQRASKTVTTSKGANIRVMACISSAGLGYWERHFGSNNADTSNEFLRRLLHKIAQDEQLGNVALVLGNAPCHARTEHVFQETLFNQACLLRLGPYSPMLNPLRMSPP